MAKRKFSAAQLRAQRAFAARYGGKKRKSSTRRRRSSPPVARRSRRSSVRRSAPRRVRRSSRRKASPVKRLKRFVKRHPVKAAAYGAGGLLVVSPRARQVAKARAAPVLAIVRTLPRL